MCPAGCQSPAVASAGFLYSHHPGRPMQVPRRTQGRAALCTAVCGCRRRGPAAGPSWDSYCISPGSASSSSRHRSCTRNGPRACCSGKHRVLGTYYHHLYFLIYLLKMRESFHPLVRSPRGPHSQSQELHPVLPHGCRTQALGPLSSDFPGTLTGVWIGNEEGSTQTGSRIRCWPHKAQLCWLYTAPASKHFFKRLFTCKS